jgi:hypothetical protein
MHTTLVDEREKTSQQRCTAAYQALTGTNNPAFEQDTQDRGYTQVAGAYAPDDAPNDLIGPAGDDFSGAVSAEYSAQIKDFYLTSCVTGVPKPVPGQVSQPRGSVTGVLSG